MAASCRLPQHGYTRPAAEGALCAQPATPAPCLPASPKPHLSCASLSTFLLASSSWHAPSSSSRNSRAICFSRACGHGQPAGTGAAGGTAALRTACRVQGSVPGAAEQHRGQALSGPPTCRSRCTRKARAAKEPTLMPKSCSASATDLVAPAAPPSAPISCGRPNSVARPAPAAPAPKINRRKERKGASASARSEAPSLEGALQRGGRRARGQGEIDNQAQAAAGGSDGGGRERANPACKRPSDLPCAHPPVCGHRIGGGALLLALLWRGGRCRRSPLRARPSGHEGPALERPHARRPIQQRRRQAHTRVWALRVVWECLSCLAGSAIAIRERDQGLGRLA